MFSIIIPTYNNLAYLKLCLHSINKNSEHNHEILVHVNEGNDGTLKYLDNLKIRYTYSKKMLEFVTLLMKQQNLLQKNI